MTGTMAQVYPTKAHNGSKCHKRDQDECRMAAVMRQYEKTSGFHIAALLLPHCSHTDSVLLPKMSGGKGEI